LAVIADRAHYGWGMAEQRPIVPDSEPARKHIGHVVPRRLKRRRQHESVEFGLMTTGFIALMWAGAVGLVVGLAIMTA
jgi:hypothetical protein